MLDNKFFISDEVEERSIEMGDGSVEVLHFKHLSNTALERYAIWLSSADEDVIATASARLVALGLCEPDGKTTLSVEQAERIKRPVMQRIVKALLEVNGYGKQQQQAQEKTGND